MTYRTTLPISRGLVTAQPTDGVLSFITEPWRDLSSALFGAPSDDACMKKAKAATADLDRQTTTLASTWRPTGLFQVDDVRRLRDATFAFLKEASASIDGSIKRGAPQAARDLLTDRLWKIYKKMDESRAFTTAINDAQANQIRVIESPGFKRWVIESMTAASNGFTAVAYFECIKPFVVSLTLKALALCTSIAAIARTVVNATVAVGEAVLAIPDTVSKLWTWTKWGALGVAAYYLAKPKKPAPTSNPARRRRRRR